MFANDPRARQAIYYVTLAIAVAVLILKHVPTTWAASAVDAGNELVTYLAGLSSFTAAGNVTKTVSDGVQKVSLRVASIRRRWFDRLRRRGGRHGKAGHKLI